jgi:hypothetical protein
VAVLVGVTVTFLVAFLALSLDAGRGYVVREHVQQAVDAAALSGARYLPEDPAQAQAVALAVAQANGLPASQVTLAVSDGGRELDVRGELPVRFFFAPLFGVDSAPAAASAAARVGDVQELSGVVPLGVVEQNFVPGQTYTLKEGGGQGSDGNYGAVWLGDGSPGADTYRADLENGSPTVVRLGQVLETETGNMVGPTDQGLSWRLQEAGDDQEVSVDNPRLVFVPVITPPGNGRSSVTVVGFAAFFLQSVAQGVVTGQFLEETVDGPAGLLGSGTYGLKAVQLVQ